MFEQFLKFLTESLKLTGPLLVLVLVVGYFLKLIIEKRIDRRFSDLEEIAKTSLDIKKGLRESERTELVEFRVAVDKWEYFVQSAVFDYTMDPATMDVAALYKKDRDLFGEVRIAVIKASTYLRDAALEQQLMSGIIKIRQTYYPILNASMPRLIELQAQAGPIENRRKAFALTSEDVERNKQIQSEMTVEVGNFRDNFLAQYRSIAEQMFDLKEAINVYIYRPIQKTDINKE